MFHRFIRTVLASVRKMTTRSALQPVVVCSQANSLVTTAHKALTVVGIASIVLLGAVLAKPGLADQIRAQLPLTQNITSEAVVQAAEISDVISTTYVSDQAVFEVFNSNIARELASSDLSESRKQQQLVTYWISKRYRVAGDAADMFVRTSYATAKDLKLDPLLILAVIAIESRFNPYAESEMGAQGLMQVMSKIHHDKFHKLGGIKAALDPAANIRVGSMILKEYVNRGGSVEAGLKSYVGAALMESDAGYGGKVLEEYRRLKEVATGKRVPIFTTTASSSVQKQPAITPKLIDGTQETVPDTVDEAEAAIKDDQVATL